MFVCRGAGPTAGGGDLSDKLGTLKSEIEQLEQVENHLDQQKSRIQQSIRNVADDLGNHLAAYATHEDICHCFKDRTLLAIQAPSGTTLAVPVPEAVSQTNAVCMVPLSVKSCDRKKPVITSNPIIFLISPNIQTILSYHI